MSELCRLRRSEGHGVCDDAEAKVYKAPSRHSATFVSAFLPLPFAVGHGRFPTLADGSFQVLGQLQHLDQVDKLFHCDGIVIDP